MLFRSYCVDRHMILPHEAYYIITGEAHYRGAELTKAELLDWVKEKDTSGETRFRIGGGMDFGNTHYFAFTAGFEAGNKAFVTTCIRTRSHSTN